MVWVECLGHVRGDTQQFGGKLWGPFYLIDMVLCVDKSLERQTLSINDPNSNGEIGFGATHFVLVDRAMRKVFKKILGFRALEISRIGGDHQFGSKGVALIETPWQGAHGVLSSEPEFYSSVIQ